MLSDFKFFLNLLTNKQKVKLLFIFCLIIIGSILEVLGIALIIPILNSFTGNDDIKILNINQNLFSDFSQNLIILYMFSILVIFFFFKFIFLLFSNFFQSKYFSELQQKLSMRIFSLYLNQEYTFFVKRNSSELIRNVFIEMPSLVISYLKPSLFLLSEILIIFGISIVLLLINPFAFLLLSVFFLLFIFFINSILRKKIHIWGKNKILHEKMKIKTLNETFSTIKNIKILGVEYFFYNKFLMNAKPFFKIGYRIMAIKEVPRLAVEFIIILLFFLLIIYFYYFNLLIDNLLPFLGIFAVSAIRLMPSINRIIISFQGIQFAKASLTALIKEFKSLPEKQIINTSVKYQKKIKFEELQVKNLFFEYNNRNSIFENLNFRLDKNNIIGIFGKSGIGKTTFIDVLLGFLKPSKGEILINSEKLFDKIDEFSWRKSIGYVPQDVNLLDDSIKNNIALGQENVDYNNLNNAIDKSDLTDFVKSLKNGINEFVGEKGIKISGGQKQRIGIARAIYNECQLLILDESTNSLDRETENNILKQIKEMKKDFTIIIISHKSSIMDICDKVYYLKEKKLFLK